MNAPADPPGPPSFSSPVPPDGSGESPPDGSRDGRLYAREMQNWRAIVKRDFDRLYCHAKMPGEDFYHLLTGGELYLDNGESKLCLNCALRTGALTTDRQHWQRAPKPTEIRIVPNDDVGL